MSGNVIESTMVCPAEETPRRSLWLSRLDMLLRQPISHTTTFFIYTPTEEQKGSKFFDTEIMKESLRRVLVPFYPMAGRLKNNEENGRIDINCNAAGVLFEVAETSHLLDDFECLKPNPEFRQLVLPTCDYSGGLSSFPLFSVRITRFKCGRVCIGFAAHHHMADGMGHLFFKKSWARLARGLQLEVQPLFDRTVYLCPRDPPQVKFQHLEYEPPLPPQHLPGTVPSREEMFNLPKDLINTLKLEATSQSNETQIHKFSTFEVIAGHIWRCATKARGLEGDQDVKLRIPTDGRSRFNDSSLIQGYFGNLVFSTACIAKASDITSKPLWYAASKIHDALQRVRNMEFLQSAIDYLESQPETIVHGAHNVTSPNLSINSWGRLPFNEADFGWGKPYYVGHGGVRYEGQSYLASSATGDGSFSLNINLFTIHMPLFENCLYVFKR